MDSGEIDPSEEECIEILETTSMDEEYRMLQSDLCFYPTTDAKSTKDIERKGPVPKTICVSIDYEEDLLDDDDDDDENEDGDEDRPPLIPSSPPLSTSPVSDIEQTSSTATNVSTASKQSCTSSSSQDTVIKQHSEPQKNEVIFKNFFGATKNAIFRTAQSIRENHDKKNSKSKDKDDTSIKSPIEITKKRDFSMLRPISRSSKNTSTTVATTSQNLTIPELTSDTTKQTLIKSCSNTSLNKEKRVPGIAQCMINLKELSTELISSSTKNDRGQNSLLRFFESPVFNIHFAIHYLFYSKEPGVLSFIVNKLFSFADLEVDLYIPQLILMYIQMDELTEVLDPYLTYRCRRSADFSLKCLWLLEAYNCNIENICSNSSSNKKSHLHLIKELNPKREKRNFKGIDALKTPSSMKKTHHRSQSDATGILNHLATSKLYHVPSKLCLGDLNSGRAFDNNCVCFESVRGTVNDLLGQQTVCSCGASKLAPQKEFLRALIDIGKTLTSLPTKIEKTSRLRVLLNLINKNLPARVWLPLYSEVPHHVVRITEEKTAVLNSKDKTPYIIYVEVVEVNDIYTSPVIPKLMPTLRHTKSEECLDGLGNKSNGGIEPPIITQSFEDDVWSQDDDLITAQYLNIHKLSEKDAVSQHSLDSMDSREAGKLMRKLSSFKFI